MTIEQDFETVRNDLQEYQGLADYTYLESFAALSRIREAYEQATSRADHYEGEAEAGRSFRAEVERLEAQVTAMQNMALSTGHYTADQALLVAEVERLTTELEECRREHGG